jgi:hypothetical protein
MTKLDTGAGVVEYLTPAAVAKELNVSVSAVYSLIYSRDLLAVNLAPSSRNRKHGFWRISSKNLQDFLSRRVVPAQEPASTVRHARRSVTEIPNLLDA